jgi:chromosome segregation ATPase
MPPEDIAAIRGLLQEELRPIRAELEKLSGLPGSLRTLQDQYLELTAALEALKPMLKHHREEINAHGRNLRDLTPKLEALAPKVGELAILVPQAIARIETAFREMDANKREGDTADAELRQSLADHEKQHATAAGR